MKPGNDKSCPVCGSELKPLFSSFFCPACESKKTEADASGCLSMDDVVALLGAKLPERCKIHEDAGGKYVRWGSRDWAHITICQVDSMAAGMKDYWQFTFPGDKIPLGMVEGVLRMFGGTL